MIKILQIDNVIIFLKRRIIKLIYQIKNFIRSDHEFADFVKSFINEIINYIITRLFKFFEFVSNTFVILIERKTSRSRSNFLESIS